jgi:CDP-diacylglycerol--glycerol-3-phosphate 3-phosphatidyltransferase/cardiolipin synthase
MTPLTDGRDRVFARGHRPKSTYSARDLLRAPSLLSLARLPLAVLFALEVGRPRWAMVVLLVAGLSDVLDGWIARRFGQVTPAGAVLDAVMDKVFVAVVAVALITSHALSPAQAVLLGTRDIGELVIGMLLMTRDRALLARPHSAHAFGKMTTWLQYVVVSAAVLRFPGAVLNALVASAAIAGVLAAAAYSAHELGLHGDRRAD